LFIFPCRIIVPWHMPSAYVPSSCELLVAVTKQCPCCCNWVLKFINFLAAQAMEWS
jgi:hypothetical protein